jgi:hypothetical protein
MSPFAGKTLDHISEIEKQEAVALRHELTGFAADNTERQLFLKFAFQTGDISTVWLDPVCAGELFWYLKRLLKDRPESDGSPLKFATDVGPKTGGYLFPSDSG